jgi:hypothetical protein
MLDARAIQKYSSAMVSHPKLECSVGEAYLVLKKDMVSVSLILDFCSAFSNFSPSVNIERNRVYQSTEK